MYWKKRRSNARVKICILKYCVIILAVSCLATEIRAFIGDETHHRKVIIHVPVLSHTIYKVIEKGSHMHGGEVHHHHHHGGHVAHIHKHEAEAAHKHHHFGHTGHLHEHTAIAAHKHMHQSKGEHAHIHKDLALNNNIHRGLYGHDHKHTGPFSNMYTHSGAGLHSHEHLAESFEGHGHGRLNHFTNLPIFGNSFVPWITYQIPSSPAPVSPIISNYHKHDQKVNYKPFHDEWSPRYTPYFAYPTESDYKVRPVYYLKEPTMAYNSNFSPQYSNEYASKQNNGGVTTYSAQNSKQVINTEYEEQPKVQKQKRIKKIRYGIFTPQLSAELDDTLHSMHAIDDMSDESVEDERSPTSAPENSHESSAYEDENTNMSSEEDGMGYQSQLKAQVVIPQPKRRNGPTHTPLFSYKVTEATPYH